MQFLYVANRAMLSQAYELADFTKALHITQNKPNSAKCSPINSYQDNSGDNIQTGQSNMATIYLQLDEHGLAIINAEFKPIYVAEMYTKLCQRLKNLNKELLIQAIKLKSAMLATVWDLTAGLGRDAILMANFGYSVVMVERQPILATILYYAIHNQCVPNYHNLSLIHADSLSFLAQEHTSTPDIIYLDPMFQDKKMAKSKKEMQIIEQLVNMDDQLETVRLFQLASKIAPGKIVVKRDNKQQNIIKFPLPSYTKSGTTVRYDVYQNFNCWLVVH